MFTDLARIQVPRISLILSKDRVAMQKSVLCVVSGTFVAVNVWLNFFFFWEETGNCGWWSTACADRLVTLRGN